MANLVSNNSGSGTNKSVNSDSGTKSTSSSSGKLPTINKADSRANLDKINSSSSDGNLTVSQLPLGISNVFKMQDYTKPFESLVEKIPDVGVIKFFPPTSIKNDNRVCVVIPGACHGSDSYDYLGARLANDGNLVFVLDTRGLELDEDASKVKGIKYNKLVGRVSEFLEILKKEKGFKDLPLTLIGHSIGAQLAIDVASNNSNKQDLQLLLLSPPGNLGNINGFLRAAKRDAGSTIKAMVSNDIYKLYDSTNKTSKVFYSEECSDKFPERVQANFSSLSNYPASTIYQGLTSRASSIQGLQKSGTDIHIFIGGKDNAYGANSILGLAQKTGVKSTVYENDGHNIHDDINRDIVIGDILSQMHTNSLAINKFLR